MANKLAAAFIIGLTLAAVYGVWPLIQTLASGVQR